jgi:hydroxymethylbilane synthase
VVTDSTNPIAPLRLATRSSPLALLQVELVGVALAAGRHDGAGDVPGGAAGAVAHSRTVEAVALQSSGDLRRDVPIHAIGGRGVFVKEIDDAVMTGLADASVHSAKDLPSSISDGLVIAAYLPRADPRDALVGTPLPDLAPGAVVASGSVRRRAQLAWLRTDLRFAELRGNIASRLDKVPPGGAVVVALAALERLGVADAASYVLSTTEMLPQVGQGAIAVCCRPDDAAVLGALQAIDDARTRAEVESERSWLRAVGGGCEAPVGAYAQSVSGGLRLEAMIASLDGHVLVREAMTGSDPSALGEALAARLLYECGGQSLLAQAGIRS